MRLASSLALIGVLLAAPASAQVWVATDSSGNSDAGSATTLSGTTTLDVGANEAVFVCAFNNGTTNITSVGDGAHTYTGLTQRNNGSAVARLFYTLTTGAGAFTPTVTYEAATTNRGVYAVSYTRTGTPSFVTENGSNGFVEMIDSGTLVSTGVSDLLSVACATGIGEVAQAGHAIYGMTASGLVVTGFNQTYWDLRNHSSASGSATATVSGGDSWVVVAGAFVSSGSTSTSGPQVGSVASVGAGR